MLKIEDYPVGYNLTLLNIIYKYGYRDLDTGKWQKDYAIIIYKDNIANVKKSFTIYEPEYTWYLLKPEFQSYSGEHFRKIEDLIPITCKYNSILKSIADKTGNSDLYKENVNSGNGHLNRKFFTHPRVFGADYPIRNYLMIQFAETYLNPVIDIDIIFFDIESDIINCLNDNVEVGEGIVNLISLYCTKTRTMYSLILRDRQNPQIQQLEYYMAQDRNRLIKEYREFVKEQVGDNLERYNLVDTNISVGFFDTEVDLISGFFYLVRKLDCEFLTAWNLFGYDIRQLIARLVRNNVDPLDYVVDKSIFPKVCNIILDERHLNELEERVDLAEVTLKTLIVDQEIMFASRRKGQKKRESYSLESIGSEECNMHKLDYHDIVPNIAKFPWVNFRLFWFYNIEDVLMQVCIEAETDDIKFAFNNMIEMRTPIDKIYRQTVFLSTKAYEYYKQHEGVIIGDNINKFNNPPKEKFPGAFVADPMKISDDVKTVANGIRISKYNNANDFDYKALYPSLLKEFNMSPSTLIGMIMFDKKNTPYKDPDYLVLGSGGSYVENLASYNYIEFCHRWMNLANVDEIIEDIKVYFSRYRTPQYISDSNNELDMDRERKIIAYQTNNHKRLHIKRPIPDYILREVDNIRKSIPLSNTL